MSLWKENMTTSKKIFKNIKNHYDGMVEITFENPVYTKFVNEKICTACKEKVLEGKIYFALYIEDASVLDASLTIRQFVPVCVHCGTNKILHSLSVDKKIYGIQREEKLSPFIDIEKFMLIYLSFYKGVIKNKPLIKGDLVLLEYDETNRIPKYQAAEETLPVKPPKELPIKQEIIVLEIFEKFKIMEV